MSNPTIKKRVCDRCGEEFFETYRERLCKDCMNELGWEYTPKTNADHIRSMTDEELAKRLIVLQQSAICYVSIKLGYTPPSPEIIYVEDFKSVLDWLKQPYKEDT